MAPASTTASSSPAGGRGPAPSGSSPTARTPSSLSTQWSTSGRDAPPDAVARLARHRAGILNCCGRETDDLRDVMPRTVTTFCRICLGGCRVKVTVSDDGRVERIGPDKENPYSWRDFCAKWVDHLLVGVHRRVKLKDVKAAPHGMYFREPLSQTTPLDSSWVRVDPVA